MDYSQQRNVLRISLSQGLPVAVERLPDRDVRMRKLALTTKSSIVFKDYCALMVCFKKLRDCFNSPL